MGGVTSFDGLDAGPYNRLPEYRPGRVAHVASARIIDGKAIAAEIEAEIAQAVRRHTATDRRPPCLAAVLVGDDPASQVYVRNKHRACARVGIESRLHRLPATCSAGQLLALVEQLNADADVDGILVQLPLPRGLAAEPILDAVHPLKDVDAFHPENVGLLMQGRPRFLPCTPHAVVQILHRQGIRTAGQEVVVLGRSDIVGKPLAMMLAQRTSAFGPDWANATVTLCHTRTAELTRHTRRADILIAAVGQPQVVRAEMIRPGAAVIDVGINRTADGLVGDVDFAGAREVAGQLTPVPGGVGPLTICMLLHNTVTAATLGHGPGS